MTAARVRVCGCGAEQLRQQATVGARCLDRLRADLSDITGARGGLSLLDEIDVAESMRAVLDPPRRSAAPAPERGPQLPLAAAVTRLPYSPAAAALRHGLHMTLLTHANQVYLARQAQRHTWWEWDGASPAALAAYLLDHADTIRTADYGPRLVAAIRDEVAHVRRSLDAPPPRQYLGPCAPDGPCPGQLWADSGPWATCDVCGTDYPAATMRAWMIAQAADELATAATIADASRVLFGQVVTEHQITGWYRHRGLPSHELRLPGHTPARPRIRRLYRVGDVAAHLAAHLAARVGGEVSNR